MGNLKDWPDSYVWCRFVGHRWLPDTHRPPTPQRPPRSDTEYPGTVLFEFICDNCDLCRIDYVVRRTGTLAARSYSYPKDYHSDSGRVTKPEVRVTVIKREGRK